jgi:hypothetical protein
VSERGLMMWRTAGCCGGGDVVVAWITIDDKGSIVGVMGLKRIFQQLCAMGCRPEADVCDELLAMVKAHNYIPPLEEERYKSALLREYTAFCASQGPGSEGFDSE